MIDIGERSYVVRETWRGLQAGKTTLIGFINRIRNDTGNVQVGEHVCLEVNKSHTFGRVSTESFATRIKSFDVL